ncbi:hypothetical protein HanPI659440_Chr10g0397811 [Helianthus annuus]|nr:hypothetical protein HanPI659440_Chr10g0397811 [Helianthus annuus]
MAYTSTKEYLNFVDLLTDDYNIPKNITDSLLGYVKSIYRSELEDRFSSPMLWIGMYIASASLVCILAMAADLVYGLRLPVDLTGSMPGYVDQVAKLGSMAFLCTMMANLLPCLGTMESHELLSNTTAMCVLVITIVVNVCIQMQTGAVPISTHKEDLRIIQLTSPTHISANPSSVLPFIYVILLVVLLIVHICSSLANLKSLQILEHKYEEGHYTAAKHIQPSPGEPVTVEKLHKHVRNYWIMAESRSGLHFIKACFHTTSASGVICLLVAILHTYTMFGTIKAMLAKDYDSDYRWSVIVILIVQSIGVVIGTIVPLFRCFTTLRFKVFFSIHFKVFKVERYWTQKLYDWKHTSIRLPFRSQRLFFNIWIQLQKGVVVLCKVIALIPLVFVTCVFYCFRCLKWLLVKVVGIKLREKNENLELSEDIRPYVLYLDNGMWVGEKTLQGFSKSVTLLIQMGTRRQPRNLFRLIQQKSTLRFDGVANFDHTGHHHVPPILSSVPYTDVPSSDCWSLPLITLTTIALSLPELEKQAVDCLFKSVREGLRYVQLVEESLNCAYDLVSFQKAARTLWNEIKFEKKWLGNELRDFDQVYTARQIVEWFRDKATHYLSGDGVDT